MKQTAATLALAAILIFVISCGKSNPATPVSNTATRTMTPVFSATATVTATGTAQPSGTTTSTPSRTATNSVTETDTPENTATDTWTHTETATEIHTITETPTCTETASITTTSTATSTRTPLPTNVVYREGINSYSGASDCSIYSATPGINSGTCSYISVMNSASEIVRTVLHFDLSALAGRTVVWADLRLYVAITSPTDNTIVSLYKLTKTFTEGSNCGLSGAGMVSWDSAGSVSWDAAGGDFDAAPMSDTRNITSSYVNPIQFNLDPATIQAWIDNSAVNYGMILKLVDESIIGKSVNFGSGENINTSLRPQLRVYYY